MFGRRMRWGTLLLVLGCAVLSGCSPPPFLPTRAPRAAAQTALRPVPAPELAKPQAPASENKVALAEEPNKPANPVNPAPSRTGPTLTASRLKLRPGQTATERALELMDQLAAAEASRKATDQRVQELQKALAERDLALRQARAEVQATRELLAQGRADLEKARGELQAMRDRLRHTDQQHLSTLEATVNLLQKAVGEKPTGPQAGKVD